MPFGLDQVEVQGDRLSIMPYIPRKSGQANVATEFILAFKSGAGWAIAEATALMIDACARQQDLLQVTYRCQYVVAMPCSRIGYGSLGCEEVARALAHRYTWLTHVPNGLRRIQGVPKSHLAMSGAERLSAAQHAATIRYVGRPLTAGAGVLVIDDIITRGETFAGCRAILQEATQGGPVFGLFLGRTVSVKGQRETHDIPF